MGVSPMSRMGILPMFCFFCFFNGQPQRHARRGVKLMGKMPMLRLR
jgi:hypothetical protein